MNLARQAIRNLVPVRHRDAVRRVGYRALQFGTGRFCPCCSSHVRQFGPFGEIPRREARCPVCGALERHRSVSLFFARHADLLADGRRILHVAPEAPVERMLRRAGSTTYVSVDLEPGAAMFAMDITALRFPDGTFDGIYCSHVLEHVADDRRAMAEFHRVLHPTGWVVLQVPIRGETTFEDPSIEDASERRRLFGQADHVRVYGADFADRLAGAGFSVTVERPAAELDADRIRRLGLNPEEAVFLCRKHG